MKKYFITGLVILLPVFLTVAIVIFVFNLLTIPFLGVVRAVFDHYQLFTNGFIIFSAEQMQELVAQLAILLTLFALTLLLGFIGHRFFFRTLMGSAEYFVKQIPLVSSIYKLSKDVIKTVFSGSNNAFKQVVFVRFPNPSTYSIGLITREEIPDLQDQLPGGVAVFVPTTPNPTSGFLVLFQKQDLIYLDMKVEDAFKYIVSCGVIAPLFKGQASDQVKVESEPRLYSEQGEEVKQE